MFKIILYEDIGVTEALLTLYSFQDEVILVHNWQFQFLQIVLLSNLWKGKGNQASSEMWSILIHKKTHALSHHLMVKIPGE